MKRPEGPALGDSVRSDVDAAPSALAYSCLRDPRSYDRGY